MSDIAPSSSLFSVEGAPLGDPAEVDQALAALWDPPEHHGRPGASMRPTTRVSVANLIVIATESQSDEIGEVVAELSAVYPTRTIVVLMGSGCEVRASVSALCHVPQEGEPQVCCEQIMLHVGPEHLDDLDHTLWPLLESDVPVMCWWRTSPAAQPALFDAVKLMAQRIIVDSDQIAPPCSAGPGCALRDLGWYVSGALRELLARMFDGCDPATTRAIDRVEFETGADSSSRAQSLWLAAFLAGQLDWRPSRFEPCASASGGGRFHFTSNGRDVQVRITVMPAPEHRLHRIAITGAHGSFELLRHPHQENEYRMSICGGCVCEAPRSVHVPPGRTSQGLAAALVGRPIDRAYLRAQPVATWMRQELSAGVGPESSGR